MICPFIVGQRVVCIATGHWVEMQSGATMEGPKTNDICQVTRIDPTPFMFSSGDQIIRIELKEWPAKGFVSVQFRPLNERPTETSIEVFKKLVTPNKVLETTP